MLFGRFSLDRRFRYVYNVVKRSRSAKPFKHTIHTHMTRKKSKSALSADAADARLERLLAMAQSRSDSLLRIGFEANTIVHHFIKLLLWPNHEAADHWRREEANFLSRVYKLTFVKGGKRLTAFDVDERLFDRVDRRFVLEMLDRLDESGFLFARSVEIERDLLSILRDDLRPRLVSLLVSSGKTPPDWRTWLNRDVNQIARVLAKRADW